jgi:hypothetical protein
MNWPVGEPHPLESTKLFVSNRCIVALYELWKESPDQISDKRVDQIIGFAGDGKLGDKNTAPVEFRAFLARVPAQMLTRYAEECLSKSFTDSGLALQDIVHEIGQKRRLLAESQ